MEYDYFCPDKKEEFVESCEEVLILCRDGRQSMIFVETLESMVGLQSSVFAD